MIPIGPNPVQPPPGPQQPQNDTEDYTALARETAKFLKRLNATLGAGSSPKSALTLLESSFDFVKSHPFMILGGGLIYSFPITNWAIGWLIKGGTDLVVSYAVPPPVQAMATYIGYEFVRNGGLAYNHIVNGTKPAERTPQGLGVQKHIAVGGLILCVDESMRNLAKGLWAIPTVQNTLGVCMAVDYANIAIKEGVLIPRNIVSLAEDASDKISKVASFARNQFGFLFKKFPTEAFLSGFKTIYDNAKGATVIGTAATVGAIALGLPELGATLALSTAVPFGFSVEQIFSGLSTS